MLCSFFVPTGIHTSERNRPAEFADTQARPTRGQLIVQAMSDKAVTASKVMAAQVVQSVYDAMDGHRFYICSHPDSLGSVQVRLEDIMTPSNPTDQFAAKPELRQQLRAALREKA